MPPRRKAKMSAEAAQPPFSYPRISRDIMEEVRRLSYENPRQLSEHAEALIPTLPEDLQAALMHDFGEEALKYPPRERKETNMNLARMIVAFSLQIESDAAKQGTT